MRLRHTGLYTFKKILYRNILKNNIIITNLKKTDGFTEILIDLNLDKAIGSSAAVHDIKQAR